MGIIIAGVSAIVAVALGAAWLARRRSRAARAEEQQKRDELELAERALAERTGRPRPGERA